MFTIRWKAIGILLWTSASITDGQPRPIHLAEDHLALSGRVLSVTTRPSPYGDDAMEVTATVKLQYFNSGQTPILLLQSDESPLCAGAYLTQNNGPAQDGNVKFHQYFGPSASGDPKWATLRRSLDQPHPPPGTVRAIAPGAMWEQDTWVSLRPPIKIDQKNSWPKQSMNWQMLRDSSPLWLTLQCELWPTNVEADRFDGKHKLGHKLQKQWHDAGELRLEPITSDPMQLDLRTQPGSPKL
jgi:hypothetical protein